MPNETSVSKRIEMDELTKRSVLLQEYDEETRREYFLSLAHMYKDAKVGDEKFKEICQGRAEGPASRNELFSTCGEWIMFLLERAGYRGPLLNRTVQMGAERRAWVSGKNIEYLFSRARRQGVFVEYLLSKDKSRRPKAGDVVYIAEQGKPLTEHVLMFSDLVTHVDAKDRPYEVWHSIDGGQGGRSSQHIAECNRIFHPHTGKIQNLKDGEVRIASTQLRDVIGWVNIAELLLTEPANLVIPAR